MPSRIRSQLGPLATGSRLGHPLLAAVSALTVLITLLVGLPLSIVPVAAEGNPDTAVPGTTRPVGPSKTPVTPIFSARRVPELLRSRLADEQVPKVVQDATKDQPPSSCVAITDHGRRIHDLNGAMPVMPASLMKLLTGSAALAILGPDTRLVTTLEGPAVGADGVVRGDVYLVGGGDPLLYTAGFQQTREYRDQPYNDFNQLADRVKAAGITQIDGSILGDDSRYDAQRSVSTWEASYQKDEQVGALSALQVNWGEAGLENDPNRTARNRRLGDPPALAATTLRTLLEQRGIKVTGPGIAGHRPAGPPGKELARLESHTIRELVGEMESFSDNNTAELLTKEIGLRSANSGTTQAGVAAILAHLRDLQLPLSGINLADGSGLDRNNRLSCNLVVALLDRSGPESDLAKAMAIIGHTGTMKKRKLPFADGRVTAKTGTLKDVVALAGFERTTPGSTITFVSIQNGNSAPGITVQDALINGLLSYPQGPDPVDLGPEPPR